VGSLGGVDLVAEAREGLRGALVLLRHAQHQHGAPRSRIQILSSLRQKKARTQVSTRGRRGKLDCACTHLGREGPESMFED
jgi:hypothetical protein